MGVEGSIDDEPLNTQSANPQNRYPQTAQLAGNMPVLRRWRPRDGRTKEYHLHVDSLVDAVIAAGWHPNILQELHIRQGKPTPFYLDSQSTVFVAKGAAAVKKTVWLTRRAAVLQEGVQHDEILPIHISEKHMLADPYTKYLKQSVWYGHMRRIHNLPAHAQKLKAADDTLK